jgi:hypothetical protein
MKYEIRNTLLKKAQSLNMFISKMSELIRHANCATHINRHKELFHKISIKTI